MRNLIVAPVREHSRKPDEIYNVVESLWPCGPFVELFARHRRPGWFSWGDGISGDASPLPTEAATACCSLDPRQPPSSQMTTA
jgi:hypothetical protein